MIDITRRALLQRGAVALASASGASALRGSARGGADGRIKFTMDLRCSSIGVRTDQKTRIDLAHKHGFQSVTPDRGFLAGLSGESMAQLIQELQAKHLTWGAAGFPVRLSGDENSFAEGIKRLPRLASGLQRAGVTRVGTAIMPAHPRLTYRANFRRYTTRVRACAVILGDQGLRLGLEYIATKTLCASSRHSFIHTMAETKGLIAQSATIMSALCSTVGTGTRRTKRLPIFGRCKTDRSLPVT